MKSHWKSLGAALVLSCAAGAACAESALTARATDLQGQPQADAAAIVNLPENTKVDVVSRRGAWTQVKTAAGQTGWVRMLNLKQESSSAAASSSGSGNPVSGLATLLGSGRTSSSATTTTGVKGLQKEDVQNAQANPTEFQKFKTYAVGKDAGEAFAKRSKLHPNKLEYLSEPAANRGDSTSSLSGG